MMNEESLHIHELMIEKIAGIISPEREAFLDDLIEKDEDIKGQWEAINNTFLPEDRQNNFARFDNVAWLPAEEITGRPPIKAKTSIIVKLRWVGLAAASVAAIALGIYLFNADRNTHKKTVALNGATKIQQKSPRIVLKLASGQEVDLSLAQNTIRTPEANLNNSPHGLTYSINDATGSSVAINSLIVPVGKDYHLVLSDGTEIWLNSASRLDFSFMFPPDRREVTLTGEAFLKVAKDPKRPFHVKTKSGDIEVLGTQFNVNSYEPSKTSVALVEGSVKLSSGSKSVRIRPGTEAVGSVGADIKVHVFDNDEVLGWRQGKYYFSDATLEEIVKVMPRWFGFKVIIDKPALKKELFTGVMDRNKPAAFFLENITTSLNMQYSFDSDSTLHFQ